MSRFGIIADDLTGALDTGVQFSKTGLRTVLQVGARPTSPDGDAADAPVSVLDTESRDLPPDVAYERVRRAARRLAGRVVYKKIDSTLRGNVGRELDAVMDALGLERALVAPAFPANGRTTVGGRVMVHGQPLLETSFAADPLCPATDNVPALLAGQSARRVGHVALDVVERGAGALRAEIARRAEPLLVVDALSDAHLRAIAAAAAQMGTPGTPPPCLTCGSAGLAQALPAAFGVESREAPFPGDRARRRHGAGPVLVVAGSRHPATLRQIEAAVSRVGAALVGLDPLNGEAALALASGEASERLRAGEYVVVTTALAPYLPGRGHEIAAGLGRLAVDVLSRASPAGLVLTGGSVAFAACRALDVAAIELRAEVAPGVPSGVLLGGPWQGMRVVTKAGGFGSDDAILRAIEYLGGILENGNS